MESKPTERRTERKAMKILPPESVDEEYRELKQGDVQQMISDTIPFSRGTWSPVFDAKLPEKAPIRLKRPYNLLGKYNDFDESENTTGFLDVVSICSTKGALSLSFFILFYRTCLAYPLRTRKFK